MNKKVTETVQLNDSEVELKESEVVLLGDKHTISTNRVLRDSGEMIAPATIARTGIMLYRAKDLGSLFKDRDPESVVKVMTKPEVLFDQATIDSCRSIPLTIGHPKQDVSIRNNKELQKGFIEGTPTPDGTALAAYVVVNDEAAIKLVDSGVDQLSLGHSSRVARVENEEWDAEKTSIIANHVAIVVKGRAQTTRIGDSGETIEMVDRATVDALEAERDSLKEKVEELKAKQKEEEETRLTDEAIENKVAEKVKARVELLAQVARLGDFDSTELLGKSDIEIKRFVVEKLHDVDMSAKTDVYIESRFDIALEDGETVTLSDAHAQSLQHGTQEKATKRVSARDEALERRKTRYNK